MNLDALVTATEAAASPALDDICRHLIGMWKVTGKLEVKGRRGRSPLYRYGDVLDVERQTRRSGFSHRIACSACRKAAQRSHRRLEPSAA